MNKLTIIGNLTRDPVLKKTATGVMFCQFTVAVGRKHKKDGQAQADFFGVTAWRDLAVNCSKYLVKGRKVCVVGPIAVEVYRGNDGENRAALVMNAQEVEFLSSATDGEQRASVETRPYEDYAPEYEPDSGFDDDLPF